MAGEGNGDEMGREVKITVGEKGTHGAFYREVRKAEPNLSVVLPTAKPTPFSTPSKP